MKKILPRWKLKYKWFMGRWAVRSKRWNPPLHIRAKRVVVEDIEVIVEFDDPMLNFTTEFKGYATAIQLNGRFFCATISPDELQNKFLLDATRSCVVFSPPAERHVPMRHMKCLRTINRTDRFAKYEIW